ncbi:MAG: FAD-dependent oxidoreductase [Polyangiaceae bacterium]
MPNNKTSVVVIGAGLAGLSAALHLAERGVDVTVCERHPRYLGGRTRQRDGYQFELGGETFRHSLDHGQHCMWFQYHNMRALLRRLGILESAARACEYTCYVLDEGDMEKAVTTGMLAASCVLEDRGMPAIPVRSLRPKTRLQSLLSSVAGKLPRPAAVRFRTGGQATRPRPGAPGGAQRP